MQKDSIRYFLILSYGILLYNIKIDFSISERICNEQYSWFTKCSPLIWIFLLQLTFWTELSLLHLSHLFSLQSWKSMISCCMVCGSNWSKSIVSIFLFLLFIIILTQWYQNINYFWLSSILYLFLMRSCVDIGNCIIRFQTGYSIIYDIPSSLTELNTGS